MYYCDLAPHFEGIGIEPMVSQKTEKEDNIRRKENLNPWKVAEKFVENQIKLQTNLPSCYDLNLSVLNFVVKAHKDEIVSLELKASRKMLMTSSKDKTIGLWHLNGQQIGKIDLHEPSLTFWKFSIDWINVRLEEFDNVFRNLELIEGKKFTTLEKDTQKNNFLVKNFIEPSLAT